MKTHASALVMLPALLTGIFTVSLPAQIITPLHRFTGLNDGARPVAGLTLASNVFFGSSVAAGRAGQGTLFRFNPDGTGFTTIHDFRAINTNQFGVFTNSDGIDPLSALLSLGNTLYGTTSAGGKNDAGTIFKLKTDGSSFAVLHTFGSVQTDAFGVVTNADGSNPVGALTAGNSTLYGTAALGGRFANGTLFKLRADGSNYVTFWSFTAGQTNTAGVLTNRDGMNPQGALLVAGNTLYGTATFGGRAGVGTVFKLTTGGTNFVTLHQFTSGISNTAGFLVNNDGLNPSGTLVMSGNALYGTANAGGRWGSGTIFKLNNDGTGFTTLHHFASARANASGVFINNEGINPAGTLLLLGSTLYGTTTSGGMAGSGTLFKVNTDGTGFRILHAFTPVTASSLGLLVNSEGFNAQGALIASDTTLYGTAADGGRGAAGTVFKLTGGLTSSDTSSAPSDVTAVDPNSNPEVVASATPPPLTSRFSPSGLVLSWPAQATGFTLQSATNLAPPVIWLPVSSAPALVDGQYILTNSRSGAQQFFRLSQ